MKKLLGIMAISALAASAFAQGTVTLQNQTGLIKQWTSTNDSTLISAPKGSAYLQIIAAPAGTSLAHSLFTSSALGVGNNYSSLSAFLGANPGWASAANTSGAVPGLMNFNAGLINAGAYTISGVSGGASADYMLLGWTGSQYATFDEALAAATIDPARSFLGQSLVFTTATGNPLKTPVADTPVSLKTTFAGMTLAPLVVIPEPTSFALAGLGLAALLVFRRRNS